MVALTNYMEFPHAARALKDENCFRFKMNKTMLSCQNKIKNIQCVFGNPVQVMGHRKQCSNNFGPGHG